MAQPFVKRDTFLPFSRPTIRQVEIDEVVDTLRSGWITTGPKAELFEDAAHGVGTLYKGRHVGLFDRLAAFSFHPIKNMTTGEGGMLTLTDPELAKKLRALRFHGLEKQAWNRYAEGGTPQVEIVLPGFKYNFMDLQAALGIHQLASVDEFNARRIELAALYHELFAGIPEIDRPGIPAYDHFHTWHLYVAKVLDSAGITRDQFMAALRP